MKAMCKSINEKSTEKVKKLLTGIPVCHIMQLKEDRNTTGRNLQRSTVVSRHDSIVNEGRTGI